MGTQEWLSFYRGGQIESENPICSLWTQACGFVRKHYPEEFHCIEGWRWRCCSLDRLSSVCEGGRKVVVRSIYSDDEKRLRSVVKLLNYVFFDRYHISRLTEIRPEMVKDFLNDYGLCRLLDYVRRKPAMYEDRILSLALECDSKCAMDRSSMSLLIFARRKISDPILSMLAESRNRESKRCIRPASSGTCSQPAYFIYFSIQTSKE